MVHIYGGWRCCKLGRGNKATIYIVGDWVESSFKWRPRHSLGIFYFLVFLFVAFMINLSVISYFHQLVKIIFNVIIIIIIAGSLARSYLKVVGIKA